jgi:hypothetical protein
MVRTVTGAVMWAVVLLAAPYGFAAGTDPISVAVSDPTHGSDRARDERDHT